LICFQPLCWRSLVQCYHLAAIQVQQLQLKEMCQQYEREARLTDLRSRLDFKDDSGPRINTKIPLNVAYTPFQGGRTTQTNDLTSPYRLSTLSVTLNVYHSDSPGVIHSQAEDAHERGKV
jgi:hypothetical protein